MNRPLDTVIKNVRVVRPGRVSVDLLDVGVKEGKFARLAPDIRVEEANEVIDGGNLLAFPGCVDAHMHVGVYQPLAQDAVTESKAAAIGGVTSSLNYTHGIPRDASDCRTKATSPSASMPTSRWWTRTNRSSCAPRSPQQGYTPFEGQELTGRVKSTLLRGRLVDHDGNIVGPARGQYLRRPAR